MKRDPEEVVAAYMVAWKEPHPEARLGLLGICWADDGIYCDPGVRLVGREALSDHIAGKLAERPGASLEQLSTVNHHHNWLRFHWRLVRADGTFGPRSIDIGQTGPDGRLIQMIGFFGELPDDMLD